MGTKGSSSGKVVTCLSNHAKFYMYAVGALGRSPTSRASAIVSGSAVRLSTVLLKHVRCTPHPGPHKAAILPFIQRHFVLQTENNSFGLT